jgi:uncharacterized membrane protein (UPF0127 family)
MSDYIYLGKHKLPTLLAITANEQEKGLMGFKDPAPVMSFIYTTPRLNRFWMRGCNVPLDIVFCRQGQIVEICRGEPNSTKLLGGAEPSDLVIELPAQSCNQLGVRVGDPARAELSDAAKTKILLSNYSF